MRSGGAMTAVAIALSCASCTTTPVGPPNPQSACSWETAQLTGQEPPDTSDTVVLVDITGSFWPNAGQQASLPDDPAAVAVSTLLKTFDTAGTRLVSFGTFDGSSATIDWKLAGAALPSPTGDSAETSAEQRSAQNCLTGTVNSAITATPQAPGTDVMAALAAAGQQLQGVPAAARKNVVLITDGLSNTGCLNLSNVISKGQPAPTVLKSCPQRATLALLHGVGMQLDGIGYQATRPPLDTAEQAWVQSYWSDMCTALQVASPTSCVAASGRNRERVSDGSRRSDPTIKFPTVSGETTVVPVPSDLLFAFDSAALSASGQAYLTLLAGQVKAAGRGITKVIGHTDATGGASYNLGLSQRRAAAVSGYLAAHGFTKVTAVGAGEADPACTPQYTPAGAPIPSCMAQNRRVQIMLGG
jgi:outer membrane protein OmpA-like peptidoglycan-associated protein